MPISSILPSPESQAPQNALNELQKYKNPLATGVELAGIAAGEFSKSARMGRKDLFQRWNKYKTGQLGMSDAEKAQAMGGASSQIAAAQAQQNAQLQQQAQAQGGTGRAGAFTQAQAANNAGAQAAQAQAAAQLNAASQAQAQQAAQQVQAQMGAQAQHVQKVYQQAGQAITNPNLYRPDTSKPTEGPNDWLNDLLGHIAANEGGR